MRSILLPLFSLTILFLFHSVISHKPLGLLLPDKVIPSLLKDAFLTHQLLGYLALGLAGYCILLVFMAVITAWLSRAINHCCTSVQPRLCSLGSVVLVFVSIISLNTIFFPHSTAAIPQQTAWVFFIFSLFLIAGVSICYAFFLIKSKRVQPILNILCPALFILWAALPSVAYWPTISQSRTWAASHSTNSTIVSSPLPHVILIGIDSLRPDYTSLFGNSTTTPEVATFLKNAVAFPETYTPIARTFPAWTSILTGKYPWEIGVDFNLTQAEPRALSKALPFTFQTKGYRTIFITDEKRFSNIDESFGFQEVAGPVMGIADFLLGTFNDNALTNLFVNGPFGRYFFPFSHANRAAYATYAPQTFIRLLSSRLPHAPQQPQFIAIHLCLPHYPFLWKDIPLQFASQENSKAAYELSLAAADAQFAKILTMLKEKEYLNNAWVVLLSDHGEGLGEPLTTPIDTLQSNGVPQGDPMLAQKDWGHGTSILSTRQHRVILAFRHYGEEGWQGGVRKQPAILADILPTVMDAVGVSPASSRKESLQGISLLPAIRHNSLLAQRPVFYETGLNPGTISIAANKISPNDIHTGMTLYSIDSNNGRLLLKPEVVNREKKAKAYGMIQQGRFLGLLSPNPQGKRQLAYKATPDAPVEIHDDLHSLPPEGQTMWHTFQQERGVHEDGWE